MFNSPEISSNWVIGEKKKRHLFAFAYLAGSNWLVELSLETSSAKAFICTVRTMLGKDILLKLNL